MWFLNCRPCRESAVYRPGDCYPESFTVSVDGRLMSLLVSAGGDSKLPPERSIRLLNRRLSHRVWMYSLSHLTVAS
jgi:hypothetical protein